MSESRTQQIIRDYTQECLKQEDLSEFVKVTPKIEGFEEITYEAVITIENLKAGLKRTKSGKAPGLDGEIKANITDERLHKLFSDLKTQKYKPRASKRVMIPKPDGGSRPLGISSQIDKVVQGAILTQLEPVLERIFSDASFGFRPKRGCHNALKKMKFSWQNTTWIIDADISKCFDKIHHEILLKLVSRYCDQALVELIRKLLNAGYVDIHNLPDRTLYGVKGTPQGSLISPILCNLYLHELDQFAQSLTKDEKFNRGAERNYTTEFKQRQTLTDEDKMVLKAYPELKRSITRVKHKRRVLAMKASRDPDDLDFRRLYYVRYADDFMFGYCGTKIEAEEIMLAVKLFLKERLNLDLNDKKSKVHHSSARGIKYLGAYLRYIHNNKITKRNDPSDLDSPERLIGSDLNNISINTMQLRAPIDRIMKKAVDNGFAKFRADSSVRATSCRRLASLTDAELVNRFSAIIRGILNYYSFVNRKSDLWSVCSLYRKSLALTLADKHSLKTAAKAFRKFGPNLKAKSEKLGGKDAVLFYPTTLKTKVDFKTGDNGLQLPEMDHNLQLLAGSHRALAKTAEVCQYEGCNVSRSLQEHHINPQINISRKDLTPFEKSLVAKKRKTVALCGFHHARMHNRKLLETQNG